MKIAYVTDTGTGRHPKYFQEKGIFCLPLQIGMGDRTYQDMEEMDQQECIRQLREKKVMTTSLPSLGRLEELFEEIKKEGYDRIIAVPICSGLSGTISAMHQAAERIGIPITTFDTHVTAVVQEYLIEMIKDSIEHGIPEETICQQVDQVIASCNTLLVPDDMQHLKRGGRLTPMAAALAGLLKIKPILKIDRSTQGRIDVIEKIRTSQRAFKRVLDILAESSPDEKTLITFAHVDDETTARQLEAQAKERFPKAEIQVIPLVNVVSIHTGLKCQAIQIFKKI